MRTRLMGTFVLLVACSGLGPPQPNETEAREIAQRWLDAHLDEVARGEGARPAGCPEITSEMLDSAFYTLTPGDAGGETAVRVTAELDACEVDVAAILVLEGGLWTAVSATLTSHEGWTLTLGRAVEFRDSSASVSPSAHHHHHHHHDP